MKHILRFTVVAVIALLLHFRALAQSPTPYSIMLAEIYQPAYYPSVFKNAAGDIDSIGFADTVLNNITRKYQFRQFAKAYPSSTTPAFQNIFVIEVNSPLFLSEINSYQNDIIGNYNPQQFFTYQLTINDPNMVPTVTYQDWHATLSFSQSGLNEIASRYLVRQFDRAFPFSTDIDKENVYLIEVNDINFLLELEGYNGGVFLQAQKFPEEEFYISITDKNYAPVVSPVSSSSRYAFFIPSNPVFKYSGLNAIVNNYSISKFEQAYPQSDLEHLRNIYRVKGNSSQLISDLISFNDGFFPEGNIAFEAANFAYTPSDFGKAAQNTQQEELNYINAKDAWGITKGDPNIKIGMTDMYAWPHPELVGKLNQTTYTNTIPTEKHFHGTQVAGLIAGKTDNDNSSLSSLGFNLNLITTTDWGNLSPVLKMAKDGVKVINNSWGYVCVSNEIPRTRCNDTGFAYNPANRPDEQDVCNEIYENGAVAVFAAGNGTMSNDNWVTEWGYRYPASFEHNLSVTAVGSFNGGHPIQSGTSYRGEHNVSRPSTPTELPLCTQHNPMVDISAPGIGNTTLSMDTSGGGMVYTYDQSVTGTSFAAPLVTATLGLMLSANNCLSPYQLEYILKHKSSQDIYSTSQNAKYTNPKKVLGAGRLDAGAAVAFAKTFKCSDPATQSMYIEGFELNHACAPGSNTVNPTDVPKVKAIVKNGNGQYDVLWMPLAGNTCTLSSWSGLEATIGAAHANSNNHKIAYYLVTVKEKNTPYPKVASKRLKIWLKTQGQADYALRDSWMDMVEEPNLMQQVDNRVWDIWHSPDIWNRRNPDGNRNHQNPEYDGNWSNIIYTRVKNYGCALPTSTFASNLKLYWTLASTGEKWDADWKTATVPGIGGNKPAGGELTGSNGITIPSLAPGDSFVYEHEWMPPRPSDYSSTVTSVDVCLLARIEHPALPYSGMTRKEIDTTKRNVWNNNNIVTRNLIVIDSFPNRGQRRVMYFANSSSYTGVFTLQVINDKNIHKFFAGDLSQYLEVVLHLGSLYNRWVSGGSLGSGFIANATNQTITYDPATPLRLDNLILTADEKFPIEVEFKLKGQIPFPIEDQFIHIRQLTNILISGYPDESNAVYEEEVFGNVSYLINIPADEMEESQGEKRSGEYNPELPNIILAQDGFTAYPNPATYKLTIATAIADVAANILITDITGRAVIKIDKAKFYNNKYHINTSTLQTGTYFIRIADDNGRISTMKFIRIE